MLISDDYQFIFVHIEKTAGTSISAALLPYALTPPSSKLDSMKRALGFPRGYHGYKFPMHANLATVQARMPAEKFAAYTKFAFVRNPWDRLVSEYNAAIKKHRRARHRKIAAMPNFSDYLDYEITRNKLFQLPRCCDLNGDMALDFVGKFENLNNDFADICTRLGIQAELPKLNAYDHAHYRSYYDDDTREKVATHWRADIEAFGYTF